MNTITLAEALLRRKELQNKVAQTAAIKDRDVYEFKFERKSAQEGMDDIKAAVPMLELRQVTAEHDHYARQLRLIDAVIQRTNWTTQVEVEGVMEDWSPPEPKPEPETAEG